MGKHELIGARTGAGSLGADGWTGCGKTRLVYHSIGGGAGGRCGMGFFFLPLFFCYSTIILELIMIL